MCYKNLNDVWTLCLIKKLMFFYQYCCVITWGEMLLCGQFRGDGRTVRTLVFGVYKICCITGSYLWVIQKDITL